MTAPLRVERRAWAKVNLCLSVGPSTGAGLHPICSWMHCISLADDVHLERLGKGEASRYDIGWASDAPGGPAGPVAWPQDQDLAVRAHQLLEEVAGRALPVMLTIRKRIPVGAGLGGGSADCAAVLAAVDDIFELGLAGKRGRGGGEGGLAALSSKLGSDVAFFIDGEETARPAIVSGAGEIVQRIGRGHESLVLLVPHFGCATGAVYRMYDELGSRKLRCEAVRELASRRLWVKTPLFNDLAEAAERVEPRLADLRREAAAVLGQPVHITGSGSAMFAVAGSRSAADDLASRVRSRIPEVAVAAVDLV